MTKKMAIKQWLETIASTKIRGQAIRNMENYIGSI